MIKIKKIIYKKLNQIKNIVRINDAIYIYYSTNNHYKFEIIIIKNFKEFNIYNTFRSKTILDKYNILIHAYLQIENKQKIFINTLLMSINIVLVNL